MLLAKTHSIINGCGAWSAGQCLRGRSKQHWPVVLLLGAHVDAYMDEASQRRYFIAGGGIHGGNNRLLRGDGGCTVACEQFFFAEIRDNHIIQKLFQCTSQINQPLSQTNHGLRDSSKNILDLQTLKSPISFNIHPFFTNFISA